MLKVGCGKICGQAEAGNLKPVRALKDKVRGYDMDRPRKHC